MKKILIASLCVFALCFTSCASKEAPENQNLEQAPESPETDTSDEINNTEENESQENLTEESAQEENAEELSEEEVLEEYPEPEAFEEPEIITLEPEENQKEEVEAPEEVEKEEVPVIETTEDAQVTIPENQEENETKAEEAASEEDEVSDVTDVSSGLSDSDTDEVTNLEGGIDITDEESLSVEENKEDSDDVEIKVIKPSRSVTLKKFEYLDITYPGSGWIYMGLTDDSKDIAYFGRKLGTKDTKFTLQARNAGTKIVHFYKNDPLTGRYLDDYLEIIVLAENGSNKTHIEAPEYKLPVEKKEIPSPVEENTETEEDTKSESLKESAPQTKEETQKSLKPQASTASKPVQKTGASQPVQQKAEEKAQAPATSPAPEPAPAPAPSPAPEPAISDSALLLQEAQVLYNEKEYAAALAKINQFFEVAQNKRDEGLYLKGQILEAKSQVRDIKGAIDSYTSLTKNYPASKLWDSANKRIIYLKRFYLEVR